MADRSRRKARSDRPTDKKKPASRELPEAAAAHHKALDDAGHDADTYRIKLLGRLRSIRIRFDSIGDKMALAELKEFSQTVFEYPQMQGYFDKQHLTHLRRHPELAEVGVAPFSIGGALEVIAIPVTADLTQGFHIYRVHEHPKAEDEGVIVGYLIHSMELGGSGIRGVQTVRLAYDIFPPFRHHEYEPVPFSTHEVYNVSRAAFLRWQPDRFYVDARTQIRQAVTGDPRIRAGYFLKRGYYPPDQKPLADQLLVKLFKRGRGSRLTRKESDDLLKRSNAPGWIYPVTDLNDRA